MDSLRFEILPRMYVLGFYKNKTFQKQALLDYWKKEVSGFTSPTKFKLLEIKDVLITNLQFHEYTSLFYLELRFDYIPINQNPMPTDFFELSQFLEKLIKKTNTRFNGDVLLDTVNPPYILVTASDNSIDSNMMWDKETILKYKEDIGRWVEVYSGQWHDYSEELYLSRVQNNLSNRLSEMHYIRMNSAFIYMPRESIEKYYPRYMELYVFHQIMKVKALQYSMYLVNEEIDKLLEYLAKEVDVPLATLEVSIKAIEELEEVTDMLGARIFKEQIINRRQHSKRVLDVCYELFSIQLMKDQIRDKINHMQERLTNAYAKQQAELQSSQRKWVLLLNAILGSQVLFTIKNEVINRFAIPPGTTLYKIIDITTWSLLVLFVLVGIIGLGYSWLSVRFGKNIKKAIMRVLKKDNGEEEFLVNTTEP